MVDGLSLGPDCERRGRRSHASSSARLVRTGLAVTAITVLWTASGAALAAPGPGTSAGLSPRWIDLTNSTMVGANPGARDDGAMIWIPGTHHALLFGGLKNNPYANAVADTWTFNGTAWTHLRSAVHPRPSPRGGCSTR